MIDDDRYLSLRALVDYSGLSRSWLLARLKDPTHPLPHFRPSGSGKILVRASDFDAWILRYKAKPAGSQVDALLADLLGPRRPR